MILCSFGIVWCCYADVDLRFWGILVLIIVLQHLLRMEKLAIKSRSSNAKIMGSIISIAGAFVLTFYKGESILNSSSLHQSNEFLKSVDSSWAIAGIMLIVNYFLVSLWYILQVGRISIVQNERYYLIIASKI